MERETSNTGILKRHRYLIPALMAIASLGSAVLRFSGDWSHFWAVLQCRRGSCKRSSLTFEEAGLPLNRVVFLGMRLRWEDWHWR